MGDSTQQDPTTHPGDPSYLPQLDGVRGLAIAGVLLFHIGDIAPPSVLLRPFHPGWMGVDLFFVLSGFLITRILTGRRDTPDYYRRFYLRRGLRIWPLYYVVLCVALGVAWMSGRYHLAVLPEFTAGLMSPPSLTFVTPLWMYLLFLQNFCRASLFGALDQLAVTWSLCVEEHFYLTWPVAVRHLAERHRRALLWGVLALSPALRYAALRWMAIPPEQRFDFLHWVTPFHLDSIAAGCLLYLYWSRPQGLSRGLCYLLMVCGFAGAFFCLHAGVRLPRLDLVLTAGIFSGVAAGSAGLVGLVLRGRWKSLYMLRPLRYLGRISYGVYLLHLSVVSMVEALLLRGGAFPGNPVAVRETALWVGIPAAIGLAALSFRYFEQPILRSKRSIAP